MDSFNTLLLLYLLLGGLFLGVTQGFFWWRVGDTFDQICLVIPCFGVFSLIIGAIFLILSPQPRPLTPTFLQNCLIVGLFFGK